MCACTEPVRTGIGAVCVEYGRPKWPITMLNHTSLVQNNVLFLAPYAQLVRPVMKTLFFPWKTKEKKARFARAPNYKQAIVHYDSSLENPFFFFFTIFSWILVYVQHKS